MERIAPDGVIDLSVSMFSLSLSPGIDHSDKFEKGRKGKERKGKAREEKGRKEKKRKGKKRKGCICFLLSREIQWHFSLLADIHFLPCLGAS